MFDQSGNIIDTLLDISETIIGTFGNIYVFFTQSFFEIGGVEFSYLEAMIGGGLAAILTYTLVTWVLNIIT